MVTKQQIVANILKDIQASPCEIGQDFAPTNIALCKYWGKRNAELNLPVTNSLSISLNQYGANTQVGFLTGSQDEVILNNKPVAADSQFYQRIKEFLNLFRPNPNTYFKIVTETNIPVAAGLASSACGFAALTKALDKLFAWNLDDKQLSILARLGSGSAARSLWHGFVEWHAGVREDGMDSYATPMEDVWDDLRLGICIINSNSKSISSREAMQASVVTSPFYPLWPKAVHKAIELSKKAIEDKDFWTLAASAEANSMTMHALMLSSTPSIMYSEPQTIAVMQNVWQARAEGLPIFFTQDAGPNLKLLFQAKDESKVRELFADVAIIAPFQTTKVSECVYD